jgi:hypothetical protein
MCKLVGWTSAINAPLLKSHANAAIIAAHKVISRTERDGFGIAQATTKGLRSRYSKPEDFRSMDGLVELSKRAGSACGAFATMHRSSHEGVYSAAGHMIGHGRTATCAVNLTNVHPFRRKGWTMAHNGVVDWDGPKAEQDCPHSKVTCDSQHIIIALADHRNTQERKAALADLTGYAAFMALSPQGKLIVAVDDMARLYAGITSKGRWIFGTTAEIVESVADAWRSKNVTAYQLDAHTWLEFDNKGSEPDMSEWKHKSSTRKQLGYAQQSLGFKAKHHSTRTRTSYGSGTYGAGAWSGPYGTNHMSQRDQIKALGGMLTAEEAADQQALSEHEAIAAIEAAEAVDLDWTPSH